MESLGLWPWAVGSGQWAVGTSVLPYHISIIEYVGLMIGPSKSLIPVRIKRVLGEWGTLVWGESVGDRLEGPWGRGHTDCLQTAYRLPTGYLQATYRLPTSYLQATYRLPTGYMTSSPLKR